MAGEIQVASYSVKETVNEKESHSRLSFAVMKFYILQFSSLFRNIVEQTLGFVIRKHSKFVFFRTEDDSDIVTAV